jgi:hypothetical protein
MILLLVLFLAHGAAAIEQRRELEVALKEVGATLKIEHSFGDCEVRKASGSAPPRARLQLVADGKEPEAEKKFLNQIRLHWDPTTGSLTSVFPDPDSQQVAISYSARLYVEVGAETEVSIRNRYGAVKVEDLSGRVTVDNRFGAVEVLRCGAAVTVYCEYGKVNLELITGPVDFRGSVERLRVSQIKQGARIENQFGSVEVEDVRGGLNLTHRTGPVTLTRIEGDLQLVVPYCEVRGDELLGNVHLQGNNAGIWLHEVRGRLELTHRFGELHLSRLGDALIQGHLSPVHVAGATGHITIKCTDSAVFAKDVQGDLDVETSEGALVIENSHAHVQAVCRGGLLRFLDSALKAQGPARKIVLENRLSPIQIELSEAASCALELQVQDGTIDCDFPGLQQERAGNLLLGELRLGSGQNQLHALSAGSSLLLRRLNSER